MTKIGIAVCDDEKVIHEEVEMLFQKYDNAGDLRKRFYKKIIVCKT